MKWFSLILLFLVSCVTTTDSPIQQLNFFNVTQSDTASRYISSWFRSNPTKLPAEWEKFDFYKVSENFAKLNGQNESKAVVINKFQKIINNDPSELLTLENSEVLTAKLMDDTEDFSYIYLPEIKKYVPEELRLNINIYYGVINFNPAVVVKRDNDVRIAIDVSSPVWENNPDKVKLFLTRELYQSVYHQLQPESKIDDGENFAQDYFHWYLQLNGLATYVSLKANINNVDNKDFNFLKIHKQKIPEFFKRLNLLNGYLKNKDLVQNVENWHQIVKKMGINESDFNIVGAYMAEQIEDNLGQKKLIESMVDGPEKFLSIYNQLNPKADYKIQF